MIGQFDGEHRWLSNFYACPIEMWGLLFPSVENAYQAAKSTSLENAVVHCGIGPGASKRMGKTLPVREGWDADRVAVMDSLVRQKFRIPAFRERLYATGSEELVEGNTWGDRFWGVCDGAGQNHLGQILMRVRADIYEGRA